MKQQISLILNIVLIIAVGVLYFLHFNSKSENNNAPITTVAVKDSLQDIEVPVIRNMGSTSDKIVFINYDSLVENYEFFKKIQKDIETKLRNSEAELLQKQKKLEEDYQFYMQNQAMMTEQHRVSKEQQLKADNDKLIAMQQQKSLQLANQEQELNEKLLNNLYGYFNKLAKQNNFAYILTYKKGMPGVVYGTDSLDITKEVIQGLNKEYRESRKK